MAIVQMQNIFTPNGARIAMDCYNFFKEYSHESVIHSLTFLLRFNQECHSLYRECPYSDNILFRIESVFNFIYLQKQENWDKHMGSLADIYFTYSNQTDLIDRLRTILDLEAQGNRIQEQRGNQAQGNRIQEQRGNQKTKRTFYEDNQNVHNHNFNLSVLNACRYLKKIYTPNTRNVDHIYSCIKTELSTLINIDTIDTVVNRIRRDPSNFNIDCTLDDILISIWMFIESQPFEIKSQLIQRLSEEFKEMKLLCATGHMSRLINVIQGFTNDPNLQVSISERLNYKTILTSYMEALLKEAPDDVLDGIIDKSDLYEAYVIDSINSNLTKWKGSHGPEICDSIDDIVTQYCGLSQESLLNIIK
jgi:hypothetical protein